MTTHSHICCVCKREWVCMDETWGGLPLKSCGVTKVIKGNKGGPYCNACRTGIEFLRYTQAAGLDAAVLLKALRKQWEEK